MDRRTRGERAVLLQLRPDVQVDGQLVLSGSRIEAIENSSEPEVEESAESGGNQITNHGELDTVDVQGMESDIDDDASHDAAVAVRIDLLSFAAQSLEDCSKCTCASDCITRAIIRRGIIARINIGRKISRGINFSASAFYHRGSSK